MEITLENLIKVIKTLNCVYAGESGSLSIDVADMSEAAKLFETAEWAIIETGPLSGSRYFKTNHGFVVQNPSPSNKFSLLELSMGQTLGLQ